MRTRIPFGDFLYFSRGERRGILVLTAIIVLVFFAGYYHSYQRKRQAAGKEDLRKQTTAIAEYQSFMASVQKEKKRQQQPSHKGNTAWRAAVTPFPFNPNTADSTTFRRLGLPDWMTRNILRYRSRGGKFRKAEDFKKIYGLTEKQYLALLPCLRIAEEDLTREMPRPLYAAPATESLIGNRQAENYKYPPGTVINLNRADTAELKKIPGIGSNIARLIASYRQRLGGFCRIEQLQEIRLDYQQLQPWFHIDSRELRRINLNRAGIEGLRSHPYINFYQAKAFVEYRKKKGVLCSLKPFALYEEFSETDLERISPYVCFE